MDASPQQYPDSVIEAVKEALKKIDTGEVTLFTTVRDMLNSEKPSSENNRQKPIF